MSKVYLILYLLSPNLPNPGIVEQEFKTMDECRFALEKAIKDWDVATKDVKGFGAVGKCSTAPREAKRV